MKDELSVGCSVLCMIGRVIEDFMDGWETTEMHRQKCRWTPERTKTAPTGARTPNTLETLHPLSRACS